ncbi:MAG: hypothetical protein IJX10_06945 [Phascolarctobacterium sp.]|nr:hypothetical protein [Phascolarctobacterium sp.]
MFQQIRQVLNWVLDSLHNDSSYTVMMVPDNGREIKKQAIGTEHFKKIAYIAGGAALFFVASLGATYYLVSQSNANAAELAEFRRTKQAQEQKLQELSAMAESVQKDMAALSTIEEQVRDQMEQAGLEVPAPVASKEEQQPG